MFIIGKDKDLNKILKHAGDLEAKGKIIEAIKELKKAIALNPKDGNLYKRLGDLYMRSKEVKESIDAYKKGIEAVDLEEKVGKDITLGWNNQSVLILDNYTTYQTIDEWSQKGTEQKVIA